MTNNHHLIKRIQASPSLIVSITFYHRGIGRGRLVRVFFIITYFLRRIGPVGEKREQQEENNLKYEVISIV